VSETTAGIAFVVSLVVALAVAYRPLGDYMYRVYTGRRHTTVERGIYRLIGVKEDTEQTWGVYARSVLAFSVVSLLFLYGLQLLQQHLPLHLKSPGTKMTSDLSWNTAVSFVTNTDWQSYSGESTMGYVVQMCGLAVQNFVSAAVGMAVAIALVRGFARRRTGELGNVWVDLVRGTIRILLPIAFVGALVLIAGGVVENFHVFSQTAHTLNGVKQSLPGGPVASQEVIKELGTNGGGFYNANSAHPFENPAAWTNWFEIFLLLVISFSLPRTFGRMVGNNRQGYAIVSVMATLAILSVVLMNLFQLQHHGTIPTAAGGSYEGVESRFGVSNSATFASATTLTSTGAVNSFHDSYTSLGGMMTMFNMQLGEVAPGGTGSGLYGMLILAVITVFVAGLMVGRTPEYLGKKINPREIKLAASYFLVTPLIVLIGTAFAIGVPALFEGKYNGSAIGMNNGGPHGLSEVLYAFTSAAGNNGSAFAGLGTNSNWWNTTLGMAMLFGRFLPMLFALALAGSLARQGSTPVSAGTLPTHRPQFVGLLAVVSVVITALTYFPVLALAPLAEGLA
jgi:K+-transporting ATPase ATPase A chain